MNDTAPTYGRNSTLTCSLAAVLTAGVMLLAPGVLAAQEGQEAFGQQAVERLQEQYGSETVSSVQELVQSLREQGVPAEPLWNKALEGASKNVPEGRFAAGIRGYGQRLVNASNTLPDPATQSALVAAADALQRGVPESALRDVARQASGRGGAGSAIPLVVLGDLVSAGVPVEDARTVVGSALKRGQGAREMLVTSWAVRDLIGKGQPPANAARQVGRAVGRGEAPTSVSGVGSPPSDVPRPGGAPIPPGAGPPGSEGPPGQKGKGGGSGGSGGSGG